MNKLQKWQTTTSEYLVTDRWLRLRVESCKTPEGVVIEPYYVVEYPDWVSCVVLSQDLQEITMLKHYRHAIKDFVLEVPGGIIDSGETPAKTVARELKEELGLENAIIHATGKIYSNPSMMTNIDNCFVAIGGKHGTPNKDETENFEVVKMPFSTLLASIQKQDVMYQSLHIAAIFLAINFLKKQGHNIAE